MIADNQSINQINEKHVAYKSEMLVTIKQTNKVIEMREKDLKRAQEKIAQLIDLLEKSRTQSWLYIPKKSDNVDTALGGFINKYPEREKMKIMFLREQEGVYQFGQKRVHIKVGKGDQVLVRVGGGYIGASEFIDQYTDGEVDKI